MSRKVLLEAEHSLGTKSPNWRASDALGHVKGNSNLVALFNILFGLAVLYHVIAQLQKAYLTIFPRAPVGYDNQPGAWRRVGINDLIPNSF